jgi:hypothetical protein
MNDKKFKLLQTIDYKGWNSFAVEALKEFLISITKSTKISHTEKISNLINQFEAAEKNLTNTFKDIRDEYISNRNMTPDSFNLFQSWFFKYAALEERPKEVIRTIIRTNLLDDERCVSALINHNKQIQQLIKACNNDDLHDLEDGIRDRSDREPIQNLANLLGIGKNA